MKHVFERIKKNRKWLQVLALSIAIVLLAVFFFYPLEPQYYEAVGGIYAARGYLQESLFAESDHQLQNSFYFPYTRYHLIDKPYQYIGLLFAEEPKRREGVFQQSSFEMTARDYQEYLDAVTYRGIEDIVLGAKSFAGQELTFHTVLAIRNTFSKYEGGRMLSRGDIVLAINGQPLEDVESFTQFRLNHPPQLGTEWLFKLERDGRIIELPVTFKDLNENDEVMLGIVLENQRIFNQAFDPTDYINPRNVRGNSFSIALLLELIQQLQQEDITKGYTIVATGDIQPETLTLRRVGGISLKIRAAEKAGADYFFVPAFEAYDKYYYPYEDSNEYEAIQTAQAINAKLQVVPIHNVQEALDFLQNLNPKQ